MKTKIFISAIFLLGLILRLYNIANVPASLYWDEASLGYNAYTISQTLRDEHGSFLPVTNFPAFGDYKPPGYIYAAALSVKALGLNEFSVRFPSAISGSLLVIFVYFLTQELLLLNASSIQKKKTLKVVPFLAAIFVAISPWSLQMSRAAFEANFATALTALASLLFLKSLRQDKNKYLLLSALFFSIPIYTFNSHRVFVPILIAGLVVIFFRKFLAKPKMFLIFALSLVLLNAPLIPHLSSKEGRLRFEEVTWLNDLDLVKESNAQIAKSGNTALANIIYNRRVYYGREFVKHYLDHYSSKFLFMSGDVNPRLSTQAMGELYLWDGALFVLGLFFLIRFRSKMTAIIIFWFLTSPIPASVARETPHALRILNILPMPQIIIALGLGELVTVFRNKTLFKIFLGVAVGILYGFSFFNYIANYYLIYSVKYADSWQFGYKQLVKYLSTVENEYDHIHVTNLYGRPYIYFLFYKQYPLQKYLAKRNASIDEFGFWSIKSFGKYDFSDNSTTIGKWLYVEGPTGNLLDPQLQHVVTGPEGKVIFEISKSK